jgi:predicted nucleic acid-binding protein
MSVVYFDSSAFVKLLVDEPGRDVAGELWNDCDVAVSSRLAYPEVRAALAAAGRNQRLDSGDLDAAEQYWEAVWSMVRPIELTASVAGVAGRLARAHSLRGADAVHLASAVVVQSAGLVFAAWDGRLRDGAESIGFILAPS